MELVNPKGASGLGDFAAPMAALAQPFLKPGSRASSVLGTS